MRPSREVAATAEGVKIIFLGLDMTGDCEFDQVQIKSQSHLLIAHAAGLGCRAGDVGVVWGGGMDYIHPGIGECWGW
jgi:hypothetical protein